MSGSCLTREHDPDDDRKGWSSHGILREAVTCPRTHLPWQTVACVAVTRSEEPRACDRVTWPASEAASTEAAFFEFRTSGSDPGDHVSSTLGGGRQVPDVSASPNCADIRSIAPEVSLGPTRDMAFARERWLLFVSFLRGRRKVRRRDRSRKFHSRVSAQHWRLVVSDRTNFAIVQKADLSHRWALLSRLVAKLRLAIDQKPRRLCRS